MKNIKLAERGRAPGRKYMRRAWADYEPLYIAIRKLKPGQEIGVRMPGGGKSARSRLAQFVKAFNVGKTRGQRGWHIVHMRPGEDTGRISVHP